MQLVNPLLNFVSIFRVGIQIQISLVRLNGLLLQAFLLLRLA
jgi:hypothetical protein